jgi:hypothetical protein
MSTPSTTFPVRQTLLAGLLVLSGGCGVTEYESKMQQAQTRVHRYLVFSCFMDIVLKFV